MARNVFGTRKLTEEDRYTKSKISFSKTDEMIEYFKMLILTLGAAAYLWYIFK